MKETLKGILAINQEELLKKRLIKRKISLRLELDKMQAMLGPRRIDKTSVMVPAMKALREEHQV